MGKRGRWRVVVAGAVLLLSGARPSAAEFLPGDLNGNGAVDAPDEAYLAAAYGSSASDPGSFFEPQADLDADGSVGLRDLALFGAAFGESGGWTDVSAPGLFVTLNDIPDEMNNLLVVPPDRFLVTIDFDGSESALDTGSLSITSSQDVGAQAPGAELEPLFEVTPTRAVFEIPAGTELARTSHYLTVSVSDAAGNESTRTYGFAVRDFGYAPPMASHQRIFLDFDQDRSLGPEPDFIEDLREFGLSSPEKPLLENNARGTIVALVIERVSASYGVAADGSPGPDAVDISFDSTPPAAPYSRVCVGGESSAGPSYLGNVPYDPRNQSQSSDSCSLGSVYGVFPQAIAVLWPSSSEFQGAFYPLDPDHGGVPVGGDPIDGYVMSLIASQGVDAATAIGGRGAVVANGVDAFAQVVASAVAHEVGHLLGLTAPGPAPGGLFGGAAGTSNQEHNVTPTGAVPSENYLMNRGSSFTFNEMSGRGGKELPFLRPLNWAYLHDRVVLDASVTGLFPAPEIDAIAPNPAIFPGPYSPLTLTIHGDNFLATPAPTVFLILEEDPTPNALTGVQVLNPQTITGQIHPLFVPPGVHDVELTNPDGQKVILTDYLVVELP